MDKLDPKQVQKLSSYIVAYMTIYYYPSFVDFHVEKDLIQHIKMVHEGQKIQRKKTKCDVCEKMHSNKYILASHIKVIHEGKFYSTNSRF